MNGNRNSNGRQMPMSWIADQVFPHYDDWRGVNIVAVIKAESGGYEWARPMVLKPNPSDFDHLSVDRGICQFNSYWWHHVDDHTAFTPELAIAEMCKAVALPDSWSINLGPWNAYTSGAYKVYISGARTVMNSIRVKRGMPAI